MKSHQYKPTHPAGDKAPALNLNTVITTGPPENPPNHTRLFGLKDAPVFYPTHDDFVEPIKYIEKIRPVGEQYGIVKIVPPDGWRPDFSLDTETFRFRTRIQKLNSMEGETRANLNYLEQLYKFHRQQGHPVNKIPQLDKRPIDLFRLKKEVALRGGYQKVTDNKKWAEIGRLLGYTRKQCTSMSNALKTAYMKVILPYEFWLAKQLKAKGGGGHLEADAEALRKMEKDVEMMGEEDDFDSEEEDEGESSGKRKGKAKKTPTKKKKMLRRSKKVSDRSDEQTPPAQSRDPNDVRDSISPNRGEVCEICGGGENDEQILLCDGCDRGYHLYCLTPPLTAVPKTDWYCVKCLVQAGDDYGFEDGEEYSLHSFQIKCNRFKEQWFSKHMGSNGRLAGTSEQDVEKEFWRLVENPHETVEVEYGADLHSTQHGSGFPTIERQPLNGYSTDPWNLNVMPVLPDSLFCHIKSDISGMMVPWLYVGMCFSTFCWHNEDHYTYSVNYMHWGETKTWYGIPASDAQRFEEAMKKAVPELFEQQPDLLFQLVTMLSPGRLVKEGVKVVAVDQRPGQFIVTFPQAYHAGFNHGFNFCEAVNFAPQDWAPYGLACAKRYQEYRRMPCFSHDELLVTTALNDASIKTANWLKDALADMRDRELDDRDRTRTKIPRLSEILDETDRPEEEFQCCYCNVYCYLSQLTCECTTKVACLDHASELCKCDLSKRVLRKRYTDDQIREFAQRSAEIATVPAAWTEKFHKAMADHHRPPLKVLRQLLSEAEKIPVVMDEALSLKEFVDRANEWVEEANKQIVRKHQNRRQSGIKEGSVGFDGGVQRGKKYETIQRLLREAEELAFDTPEIKLLQDSIKAINEFRRKALAVLGNPGATLEESKEIYEAGLSLSIDLEEMEHLENNIKELEWVNKVKGEIDDISAYQEVDRLIHEARRCGIAEDNELLKILMRKEGNGARWIQKARLVLDKEVMTLEELQGLIDEAAAPDIPVEKSLILQVEGLIARAKEWMKYVRGLDQRCSTENLRDRPPASELKKALGGMETLPVRLDEMAKFQLEMEKLDSWSHKARKLFVRGGGSKSFEAILNDVVKNVALVTAADDKEAILAQKQRILKRQLEQAKAIEGPNSGTNDPGSVDSAHKHEPEPVQEPETPAPTAYCFCRSKEAGVMIECDGCQEWYHLTCLKLSRKEAKTYNRYMCPICDSNLPIHRTGKRPKLEDLKAILNDAKALLFVPVELDALTTIVEQVGEFRKAVRAFCDENRDFGQEDLTQLKDNLRKVEGLDVLLFHETEFLRGRVSRLAPVYPGGQEADMTEEDREMLAVIRQNEARHERRGDTSDEDVVPAEEKLYCLCRRVYDPNERDAPMIQCDGCSEWYHMACVNVKEEQLRLISVFMCPVCCKKHKWKYKYGHVAALDIFIEHLKANPEVGADHEWIYSDDIAGTSQRKSNIVKLKLKPPMQPRPVGLDDSTLVPHHPTPIDLEAFTTGASEKLVKPPRKRRMSSSMGDGAEKVSKPRKKKEKPTMVGGESLAQKRPKSESDPVLGDNPEKRKRRKKAEMEDSMAADGVIKEKKTRKMKPPEYDEYGNVIKRKRVSRKQKLAAEAALDPSNPSHTAMSTQASSSNMETYSIPMFIPPVPQQRRSQYQPYQLTPLTPPGSSPTPSPLPHTSPTSVTSYMTNHMVKTPVNNSPYGYYPYGPQQMHTTSFTHTPHTAYYGMMSSAVSSAPSSRAPATPLAAPPSAMSSSVPVAEAGERTHGKEVSATQLPISNAKAGSMTTPPVFKPLVSLEHEESIGGGGSETETDEEVSLSGVVKLSDTPAVKVEGPSHANSGIDSDANITVDSL